jgi:hypothetical protein
VGFGPPGAGNSSDEFFHFLKPSYSKEAMLSLGMLVYD